MANRLAEESSPYLLQHKDNPVDWLPWGDEALAKARDEDKPLIVSIGYSSCHWCHVMERESFENDEIAAYMNEHFVPVKVDREERPDVDAIYMEAVQSMTGRGGWPLNAFCDPEGVPFYAGTYFPPEPRQGMPSFPMVMEAVVESWRSRRDEISKASAKIRDHLGAVARMEPADEVLDPAILDEAVEALRGQADRQRGGFGGAPKFPPASALELLLARGETEIPELTLDAMARGGIHDQVGGGFARYAVDDNWLVPHFEKMLYDNALLARAYLHGFQVMGHERYRVVCERTLEWALREMRGPEGGFFSALDADSEGEEGRFYVWTPAEIRAALGEAGIPGDQADAAIAHFGVTDRGNFEGKNILFLPGGAGAAEPEGFDRTRAALYESRSRRVWPGLDDKRICSWNALMIAALADAGAALGRSDFVNAAVACAEFVERDLRDGQGRLLRTFKDGPSKVLAYLEDHAYLVEALITLYEATFDVHWFDAARRTADEMIERFGDPERGGFFTTSPEHDELITRRKDIDDHPIPSGNSSAAYGLLRLGALTGEHGYTERAEGVFRLLVRAARRHPQALAHLLEALNFHLAPTREVAVVGPGDDGLGELAAIVRERFHPTVVLAGGPEGTERPELMLDRRAVAGRAAAYVCEGFACKQPVTEPAQLAAEL
jgi:uncharacterized protein